MQSILPSATDVTFRWNKSLKSLIFISHRKHISFVGLFVTPEFLGAQVTGKLQIQAVRNLTCVSFIKPAECTYYVQNITVLHYSYMFRHITLRSSGSLHTKWKVYKIQQFTTVMIESITAVSSYYLASFKLLLNSLTFANWHFETSRSNEVL
jgi:hypothetical protein